MSRDKVFWRQVPSVPDLLVSSEGQVMVAPYTAPMPYGGTRFYGGEPNVGQWDGNRYIYRFRGETYKVHRLVCEAFNGPPDEGQVCMHLDENGGNNKPGNLEWGTQKQNLNAPGFIDYCKARTGENNPRAKGKRKRETVTPKDDG